MIQAVELTRVMKPIKFEVHKLSRECNVYRENNLDRQRSLQFYPLNSVSLTKLN